MSKLIEKIKKHWLVNSSLTVLLVAILIVAFVGLNLWIQSLNLTALDFTSEKLYTLSDESKEQAKKINEDITIYFFGYEEDNSNVDLAKQYTKVNDKIKCEVIKDITSRADLEQKYQISNDVSVIIVQAKERNKIITQEDLYSYDYTTSETMNLVEQKLTNALLDTTIANKPSVYFLEGHGEYKVSTSVSSSGTTMAVLQAYLENEVYATETLDLLITQKMPDDCKVLVIGSPAKDFADLEVQLITNYINNGGRILWLNDVNFTGTEFPNVQKVLDLYGISFETGIVMEEDTSRTFLQTPNLIIPMINASSDIFKTLATDGKIVLLNSGRLKFAESDKLTELGVSKTTLLTSSDKSYFRTNLLNNNTAKQASDEEGTNTLGALVTKKINDTTESQMIVFSNAMFASDALINIGQQQIMAIQLYNNKDLVLNSIASLADRGDSITIRKATGTVQYTPTKQEDLYIKIAIFGIPVLIILIGILVWQVRRRKK